MTERLLYLTEMFITAAVKKGVFFAIKKISKCLIAVLVFGLSCVVSMQHRPSQLPASSEQQPASRLSSVMASNDSLFARIRIERKGDMAGTGWNPYMRWVDYWTPVLFPHGDFSVARKAMLEYAAAFKGSVSGKGPAGNWKEIGPVLMPAGTNLRSKGIGRIDFLAFDPNDPNIMFACSPVGGLWRSTDEGLIWINAGTDKGLPRCGVSSIAIDETRSVTHWFISTGQGDATEGPGWQSSIGIYRTTNGGYSWECIGLQDNTWDYQIRKVIKIPGTQSYLFAATTEGLFWSKNADATNATEVTWKKVQDGNFYDVEIHPTHPSEIYAAGTGPSTPVFRWDWVFELPENLCEGVLPTMPSRRISLAISPQYPDELFIVVTGYSAPNRSRLFRYNIPSHSVVDKGEFPNGMGYGAYRGLNPSRAQAFAVSPIDANILFVGDVSPVCRALNGMSDEACAWTQMPAQTHDDVHYIVFNPSGAAVWAATDGGVYMSTDMGVTWHERNAGLGAATVHHLAVSEQDPVQVLTGTYDCGTSLWQHNGDWQGTHVLGGDGFQCLINPADQSMMYASTSQTDNNNITYGIIYRTSDGGTTSQLASCPGCHWHTFFVADPTNFDILYTTGTFGVKKSTNRGATWEQWSSFPTPTNTWTIAVAPSDPKCLYVSWIGNYQANEEQKVFYSKVGGGIDQSDWFEVPLPSGKGWVHSIAVDWDDPTHIWVATGVKVYDVDVDEGTWTNITGNLPSYLLSTEFVINEPWSNDAVYLGTSHGVFYRDASMTEWLDFTGNLPNAGVQDIDIRFPSDELFVGTFGRGLWTSPLLCKHEAPDLNISGSMQDCYRHAQHTITSDAVLAPQKKATFRAGDFIYLKPGFYVSVGSNFRTFVRPCGNRPHQ